MTKKKLFWLAAALALTVSAWFVDEKKAENDLNEAIDQKLNERGYLPLKKEEEA